MSVVTLERIYADLDQDLRQVSRILSELAASHLEFIPRALDRPLSTTGKRLRPLLVLLSARAVTPAPPPGTVEVAAAAEAIHLATLILDDVVDQAELRRGEQTLHRVWGNEIPVLLADYVFARTFARLAEADFCRPLTSLASVTTRMCEGELMEVLNRHNLSVSESQYLAIIEAKTASLFSACCQAGALVAEAPSHLCDVLAEGGRQFGLAFQIADDLLDFLGDERITGKKPGSDLACGRITLPLIHALRSADHPQRTHLESLLRASPDDASARLGYAVTLIKEHGGFDYAESVAQSHADRAKEAFSTLPASPARDSLLTLTHFALHRPA